MNYTTNPVENLADAFAHAEYVGFSDIDYMAMDWEKWKSSNGKYNEKTPKTRRPFKNDIEVFAMFTQTWGSTALGHGGMGGASVTTAYTIVLECVATSELLVYFGSEFCYKVDRRSKNLPVFIEDCNNRNLASKKEAGKYN